MISATLQTNTPEQQTALAALGIKSQDLDQVGTRILASYNQATPHDTANAAGTYAYLAAVRAARDILCPLGWVPLRKDSLEFVVQTERNLFLLVSSGDKNTGVVGSDPKTKNPKGTQTRKVVARNADQLLLWPDAEPLEKVLNDGSISTWFLLYHVSPKEGVMRMELSLPVSFDMEEFKVNGWQQRIILDSVEFSPSPTFQDPEFASDFEIEIKRKAI